MSDYSSFSHDYFLYGMPMPGRQFTNENDYRYGFNGMEKDDEVSGGGNSYTTEFRLYNPRIGRWLSLDPLMAKYPHQSPYAGFNNNPIYFADPTGLEGTPPEGTEKRTVKAGETLNGLSEELGISPEELMALNTTLDWKSERRHGNQNWLLEGETLNVPESPQPEDDNPETFQGGLLNGQNMEDTASEEMRTSTVLGRITMTIEDVSLGDFTDKTLEYVDHLGVPEDLFNSVGVYRLGEAGGLMLLDKYGKKTAVKVLKPLQVASLVAGITSTAIGKKIDSDVQEILTQSFEFTSAIANGEETAESIYWVKHRGHFGSAVEAYNSTTGELIFGVYIGSYGW